MLAALTQVIDDVRGDHLFVAAWPGGRVGQACQLPVGVTQLAMHSLG